MNELAYDLRLGRLPEFDSRSRSYPVMAALSVEQAAKPRSYTWSCTARLDQGAEGSCVGHAVAHEGVAKPAVVKSVDGAVARAIYKRAQQLDPWPGEDYSGTSILAGMKAGVELGWYREYRWAFSLDELIAAVGYAGPAVLGLNWYDDMMDVDGLGFVRIGGRVAGGHAILCNGVSLRDRRFRLTNSWGRGWGWDGQAWISFADLDRLLREDGEAAIPVARRAV